MPADPEVQRLLRSVDLIAYARSRGYDLRRADCTQSISVLEHPGLPDIVAVARDNEGHFVFASLQHPPYRPRAEQEPAADAAARLQQCIGRSIETGNTVEFVRRYERLERGPNQTQPTFEQVRAHLCALDQAERALGRTAPTLETARPAPERLAPEPARRSEPATECPGRAATDAPGERPPVADLPRAPRQDDAPDTQRAPALAGRSAQATARQAPRRDSLTAPSAEIRPVPAPRRERESRSRGR